MDKTASLEELVAAVGRGRCVSFGGGGHVRKPLVAACAIGLSDVAPVDVLAFLGGPEVDVLIAREKVARLQFAFMGLGPLGLMPNFRRARETGSLDVVEASEYLVIAGLEAAVRGVPFLPTRSGLGTDILTRPNTPFRRFECPLTGEELVAVPASVVDVAILHVDLADRRGNCLIYGDPFLDPLLARAAEHTWVTADEVVERLPPIDERRAGTLVSRVWVHGVVHVRGGAGFTGSFPAHPWDPVAAREYQRNCLDAAWLEHFAMRCVQR